ncbi:MAG: biopolymer transporter ExbD [Planctomycetes bacterium]|nr:biopolymer transporter ExbD [Planctomycetota bacterium]
MDLKKIAEEKLEMDMTPMIDCVFLLMIFFVLVIDLSQKNLEDLILPRAEFQQPDEQPPDNRPIINVLQNGSVIYKQQVMYDAQVHGKNYAPIHEMLLNIRREGKLKGTLHFKTENLGGRDVELIDDPILIRADKWTEWHYIGEIMKQCSQPDIAFWKVELAMSEKDKETGISNKKLGGEK